MYDLSHMPDDETMERHLAGLDVNSIPLYVTVYEITREYGGPEEGGWYWNRYVPVCSVPAHGDVNDQIDRLELWFEREKHGDIYSVLGGTDIAVHAEAIQFMHTRLSSGGYS